MPHEDIVDRLRWAVRHPSDDPETYEMLCREAADEIERLRESLAEAESTLDNAYPA
jgi:hypothetical protein